MSGTGRELTGVCAESGESLSVEPLTGVRRTLAKRMVAAWSVPVFHLSIEVKMAVVKERARSGRCTLTDVLVHDCARALAEHPGINAMFIDGGVVKHQRVSIAIAVATDAGLTAPVIHDANLLGEAEIRERRAAIVKRARSAELTHEDVYGGTFTISNLGMFNVRRFDAILNVPQVAILAVGAVSSRLSLVKGAIVEDQVAELTLTCDHRAVDGADGALFLDAVRAQLEGLAPVRSS